MWQKTRTPNKTKLKKKIEMLQNSKTQWWPNSKTQNLKKIQKLKMWQNSKNKNVTKTKNLNGTKI